MSYGSNTGVAALVPRDANAAGRFDDSTRPTDAQVTAWRNEVSALLDVALMAADIPTPITDAAVKPLLDSFVNGNTAWLVDSVNGRGRYEERPATTQEILNVIATAAPEWVDRFGGGIGAVLGIVAVDTQSPTVHIGSFQRVDAYTGGGGEYTRGDRL